MKLNKLLIAVGIASFALASCENELTKDAKLSVNVATNEGVSFDGQTITVKKGTPVEFHFNGDPDFLTFFSGEAGKKYEYRDRITVDENDIESSTLKLDLQSQYGKLSAIDFHLYVSDNDFPGLFKNKFEEDSVLVEKHEGWKDLIPADQLPTPTSTKSFEFDMKPYLGKRIVIAAMYKGVDNSQTQPKFFFKNMQIVNKMTDGSETSLGAGSFGLTALNMLYKHNLSDQKALSTTAKVTNLAYGTTNKSAPNISGIWNLEDINNFFIHSSGAKAALKYSWLVSNLLVVNACTPDAGTGLKDITENVESYSYTYDKPGTYTATFVATNGNYKQQKTVVHEYKVVVTE